MGKLLLSAETINFRRQQKGILHNGSLYVRSGEIVTLIGPNGAGKSTLIRIILGLLPPDSGEVRLHDNVSIGYMPQRLSIDPSLPLTVERFLTLAGKERQRIDYCLEVTGTTALKTQSLHSLSGGEFQRVLLARALYRRPQLLVLDEPVQGVDVSGQTALYRLIDHIRTETGCGVLMVSHDLHLVMAATDRVVCLNQHICCEGHPDSVANDPEFLQLFGDVRSAAVAPYVHHHDHNHDNFHSPADDGDATQISDALNQEP